MARAIPKDRMKPRPISEEVREQLEQHMAPKSLQQKTREELVDKLAELGGRLTAEDDVVFQGKKLILPETMRDIGEAIKFLDEKRREDEREVQFERQFNFRPWDGAAAAYRAMKRAFGMVTQRATPGMFFDNPPELKTITTGPGQTEQIPWGGLALAHLPGLTMYLGATRDAELGILFRVTAQGPRKYRFHIEGIFNLIEEELHTNSIYRGKAFDGQQMPQFLDLDGVDPEKVIYSAEVMVQMEASVWAPIRYPDALRELGSPLKRAVLFEGPYGTGKTLGAYLTARVAVENNWTFIYCRPGRDDLFEVMQTARLYQPSVVFFEDVDLLSDADTTDRISALLDVFDGIKAKGTEIMCVLTTNHVEQIQKGMVRPGRLDAVIHIGHLDTDGFMRMIKSLVPKKHLSDNLDRKAIGVAFEGFLPAFAREAVDRAVRYSVARNGGTADIITTDDLVNAATGLRPQLELMEGAREGKHPDPLARALTTTVQRALDGTEVKDLDEDTEYKLFIPEELVNSKKS